MTDVLNQVQYVCHRSSKTATNASSDQRAVQENKQLFNPICIIILSLTSGPDGPGGPCAPISPIFPFFKKEKRLMIHPSVLKDHLVQLRRCCRCFVNVKRIAVQTCINTQIQTISAQISPCVHERTGGPGSPLGPAGPGRPTIPWRYRQNQIWIHSNGCDAKQSLFRRTLSPWYPISPGSPRFPTSP